MSSKIRDENSKKKFVEYLEKNPDIRFGQSLNNVFGVDFFVSLEKKDVFYLEFDQLFKEDLAEEKLMNIIEE